MRILRRISLALLAALTCATPTMAQGDRFACRASVGPTFANLGTTLSSTAGLDVWLNDRASLVGEFGVLPRAPFRTFFVHRSDDMPTVNRFTAGLHFSIK